MEGFSPGVFGYKPAPSIWHKDLDISDGFLTSYVGNHFDDFDEDDALTGVLDPSSAFSSITKNQTVHAKGTKMAKFSLDSAFYTSERMIRLPYDDFQSLCNDWIPDWSARRDTAL